MKQEIVKCVGINEDGYAILQPKIRAFVRMLPGEIGTVEFEGKEGRLVKIENPSPERIVSKCPVFDQCGGCTFHHWDMVKQLEFKKTVVKNLFSFVKAPIEEVLPCEVDHHYRTKNQMVVFANKKKQSTLGMYRPFSHQTVAVTACNIQDTLANGVFGHIQMLLRDFKVEPYDEDSKRGIMRHVLIKVGYQTNQVMVVFVMAEPDFKGRKILFSKLIEKFPQVKTIIIDVNTRSSSAVLSGKQKTYVGNGYIEDKLLGYTFKISASSFFQVNPRQTEKLYGKAIEYARLTGNERVLDVYSGTGTIGILLSKQAKEVVCVESNRWAVEDAKVNAQLNKINNVKMVLADATEYMIRAAEQGLTFDVVVMDPPRSGATPDFLSALKKLSPKRIVYISCEPKTQADDVKQLISDYQVTTIQPVDMFPYTRHVEVACRLIRIEK